MAAYFFYIRNIPAGAILLIFSALFIISYFLIRSRIPFAKVILKTVTHVTAQFSGTLWVAFGGLILSAAFSFLWFLTIVGLSQWSADKQNSQGPFIALLVINL